MSDSEKNFGMHLRNFRKRNGLTQIELANASGVAVNSIRLYEGAKRTPSHEIAAKLAAAIYNTMPRDQQQKSIDSAYGIARALSVRLTDVMGDPDINPGGYDIDGYDFGTPVSVIADEIRIDHLNNGDEWVPARDIEYDIIQSIYKENEQAKLNAIKVRLNERQIKNNRRMNELVSHFEKVVFPYFDYANSLDMKKASDLNLSEDEIYSVNESIVYTMAAKSIDRLKEDLEERFKIADSAENK